MSPALPYREIWAVDFEFTAPPGERPAPLCVVARELRTGRLERKWLGDGMCPSPCYSTEPDALFVAYYASAELGCHLALDWPLPVRILDLYAEFRCRTNGLGVVCGNGLVGALSYFGLDGLAIADKDEMRRLAMRGGPYTADEKLTLVDYCQTDVDALGKLLPAMLPQIDLPRALLRGRYMAAAARMEWTGVPIDTGILQALRTSWRAIQGQLIARVNRDCGVYVPADRPPLKPGTRLGEAIFREAKDWDLDPDRLADVVEFVWREERDSGREAARARAAARTVTGLTPTAIDRWEDAGHDHAGWPRLDEQARQLAALYPALGIGRGYTTEAGYDDTDYAALLWDTLRNRDETGKPRHHPDIVRRAAELAATTAGDDADVYRPMRFAAERFAAYLASRRIPWPRLDSGTLALDDDTFREMARTYPAAVAPIRELRHTLSQMRLHELAVGGDGRNRLLLSAFRSSTGRNQPSNARFIFGPSCWLRSLIKPAPGRAVAHLDWSQQELAIAAGLSGDPRMQEAYRSGDFYLSFAKMAGAVPQDATRQSHPDERDQCKVVSLGVLYGLSADGLARRLGVQPCRGRELLHMHQTTFRRFWEWSDGVEIAGMLGGELRTVFGWTLHVGTNVNPRSLRNFPMQANGAEMMRLACCLATEQGIEVCAPIHDALLVEGAAGEIEDVVAATQAAMERASALVLPGFPLRTEAKIVCHPDRYSDPRGRRLWELVWRLLDGVEGEFERVQACNTNL
jgi:hypothetical protein